MGRWESKLIFIWKMSNKWPVCRANIRSRGGVSMNHTGEVLMGMLAGAALATATPYDVSVAKVSNYDSLGTGWDSEYVMQNSIITLAVVPLVGGHLMQFDLANTSTTLFVDSANKGKVPTGDSLFGGYRTLVSPQSSFPWPPSPILDWKPYTGAVAANTADSGVFYLQSGVETTSNYTTLKGLQYKRTITLYKASSHASVKVTLVNTGNQIQTDTTPHGIWDDAECACQNSGKLDTTNIWVYFPLNPASAMGNGRGYAQLQGTDTTQWKRNIAPGIMGVQFKRKGAKIGADCVGGWICYVNRLDGHAYAKTFNYVPGQTYPDGGSSVEVYTDGTNPFLEDEVLGPLSRIAMNDSIQFAENWYEARSFGPVLAVNSSGLITHRLSVKQSHDTAVVSGTYGVFYNGTVKSVFKNAAGTALAVADSYSVSPVDSFVLSDRLLVPTNAASLQLALYTTAGNFAGALDSVPVTPTAVFRGGGNGMSLKVGESVRLTTTAHALSIHVPFSGRYSINLIRLDGKLIARYPGAHPADYLIPYSAIATGVCFLRIQGPTFNESRKVFIP